jgi:predicted methyltransferase
VVSYRVKLAIFALSAVVFLFVVDTAYQGLNTLRRLDVVEAERDQWQRPSEIVRALNLQQGGTVVDLGCGSGYFTLKLSPAVGPGGAVYAVDIRRLPLVFLWLRTFLKVQHNVRTVLGEPDNPHLPAGTANAVLIVNTYHELDNPSVILNQISQSLVSGGRLVIADPMQTEHGEFPSGPVEAELRRHSFTVLSRDDNFINQPGGGAWWLIIASRI